MSVLAHLSTVRFVAVAVLAHCAISTGAKAQEPAFAHKLPGATHHTGRPIGTLQQRHASESPQIVYRGLTVNRRPDALPDDQGSADNILVDGPIRYGDIHSFNPVPYVSSGQQFPYGFDGIGGYGSDLSVSAGQDAAIYDRGP